MTLSSRKDTRSRSIGPALRRRWRLLSVKPGGKWLFSRGLGRQVPYTGTLGARVERLEPGRCVVVLRDRRRVRNHLHSVHAMALANLGEMATGLALLNSLPEGARGILTGFHIAYLKKARGRLLAECRCPVPADSRRQEVELNGEIRDGADEVVAVVTVCWLIGPEPET
jgi:acyl-coenzyme A thioesterase PaaI-like protein